MPLHRIYSHPLLIPEPQNVWLKLKPKPCAGIQGVPAQHFVQIGWTLTRPKADDLVVEDGRIQCPYCGHKIPVGASVPTAKVNMKTHVEKNEKCRAAHA
jgi:DNA-directed RNA polymerase subunit RPC12/RpoP